PEGGIWMSTQRPEWNDANNALVGNGVSMVTLYYLRRFLKFFEQIFSETTTDTVQISSELADFFHAVTNTFKEHKSVLSGPINDVDRKRVLDGLGQAGSDYRNQIYTHAFSGRKTGVSIHDIQELVTISIEYLEHSIRANKRSDNLYHAYNLMTVNQDNSISLSYLDEMLEGQVAVLSSDYLPSKDVLDVLDALKKSALFRPDQYSYLLYPNKELKGFLARNTIPKDSVLKSELLQQLVADKNIQIIEKDIDDVYHFNGYIKNANDLKVALQSLTEPEYVSLVKADMHVILQEFENIFNHKAFTGRSGTFYGYEGLGSIYWHMVSKLLLATQECCLAAIKNNESEVVIGKLLEHYYEINAGIGIHKSPLLYGAFPTDPYSHTPGGKGAQQPGMTGQVKEDILSRFGELGVFVGKGQLYFNPCLLRKKEFLQEEKTFNYINISKEKQHIQVPTDSLSFTYCQVPIVYTISEEEKLSVHFKDGNTKVFETLRLDTLTSEAVFNRSGQVLKIQVHIKRDYLK
ncbi:MAG: hypothetical protein ACI849_001316, partial [Patiriisocius sp.]